MSFDRDVTGLLDRIRQAGVDVAVTPTGGLLSRSNGCPIRIFVALVREIHDAHRSEPARVRALILRREDRAAPV
jgi:hypothetical protein